MGAGGGVDGLVTGKPVMERRTAVGLLMCLRWGGRA